MSKRTHPPTLKTLALRTLKPQVARGDRVLLAVSGGRDSMAMLDVVAACAKALGIHVAAHGVDHGLRADASNELDLARSLADRVGVPFEITRVRVATGANLQARARTARHEALRAAARTAKARFIATAHHADDRAETVLLRLLRGATLAGLGVLPPVDGDLIRPLILARRADIDAHVARHGIPYADDPSNTSPRFLRVRVRTEVMPLLEALNPGVVSHLCALADEASLRSTRPQGGYDPGLYQLPTKTRDALARLATQKSRVMRVLLPGGLVARWEKTQASG